MPSTNPFNDYHFCPRCWMPTTPVRRCRCPVEPYPDGVPPARVVGEYPALRQMADRVQRGGYADDRACREQRWLGWLCWLVAYGRLGGAGDGE